MSARFSHSVPSCVIRRAVCSECTVYSISQSPRESGTQKTRQAETLSGPGPGRQRRQRRIGDWEQSGRGGRGEWGAGADLRRRRGSGGNNARSNKHTKGLCVLAPIRTHPHSRMLLAGAITG